MTRTHRSGAATLALVFLVGGTAPRLEGQAPSPSLELVTATPTGAAGGGAFVDTGSARISADATHRYVVFSSASEQLVANDTNGHSDVFLRDRQTGTTLLVSRASDGTQGNGDSRSPVISANGRYVAFVSLATNLVPGDTNAALDVFVRDLQTGSLVLASVSTLGAPANFGADRPALSADGRYVAFESGSDTLVPGDTNVFNYDVFVRDLVAGTTVRVSLRPDGTEIVRANSTHATISADGRRVAFLVSKAPLSGPPPPSDPPNLHHGVYVRDLVANTTVLVSARPDGSPSTLLNSTEPRISANGRYVVFGNWEDLDPDFPDSDDESDGPYLDVFVRDLQTSVTQRVSLPFAGGPPEESGFGGTISADGRYVAYVSDTRGEATESDSVRVRDRVAGTTTSVAAPDGGPPDQAPLFAALSEDGQAVYFESEASNLVPGDLNGSPDGFLFLAAPPTGADLSLGLAASNPQPPPGTEVTLTLTVSNAGPEEATDVVVRALLPAGLSYVTDSGAGAYDSVSGAWSVATLAAGSSRTLQIVARMEAASSVAVTAQVAASSVPDPDSTPDNGDPTEDDQRTLVIVPALADLSLTLQASTLQPALNANVTLTATVSNAGPAGATGVSVRLPLPPGLVFVFANPPAYDAGSGLWTLGPLPSGGIVSLALVARVVAVGPIDVVAEVAASSPTDPDSTPGNGNPAEDDRQTLGLTGVANGIVVNHPGDQINPSDGFCTLREALTAANTDTPSGVALGECAGGSGADVIHLRATPPLHTRGGVDNSALGGPNGLPVVTSAIVIEGNGATVERSTAPGTPDFRLFAVAPGASLTLRDVTVRGGRSPLCGGALLVQGATLSLVRTTVEGNVAGFGGGVCAGASTLGLTDSVIRDNRARPVVAGGHAFGGGLAVNGGTTTLGNTEVRANLVDSTNMALGGGIFSQSARVSLTDSRVEGNLARDYGTVGVRYAAGGGIAADTAPGTPSTLELTRTLVAGNVVVGGTVTGRRATGGGLWLNNFTTTLAASTVQANRAEGSGGGIAQEGGALEMTGGVLDANTSYGSWDTVGGGGGLAKASGTAALKDVDVSGNSATSAGNGGGIFNRGPLTVTGGRLRFNIALSGGGLSNGTSQMTGGVVMLSNVAVDNNTAANLGGGIFSANPVGSPTPSSVTVNGGRVQANRAANGGGIFLRETSEVAIVGGALLNANTAAGVGGAVASFGRLTLKASTVQGNAADVGGGIYGAGPVNALEGAEVSDNRARRGAGAWFQPSAGLVSLRADTRILSNQATEDGGGVLLAGGGALEVVASSVTSNQARDGGGFFVENGHVWSFQSTFAGNSGARDGGGMAVAAGSLTAQESAFRDNQASSRGGGLFVAPSGFVQLVDNTVTANTARAWGGLGNLGVAYLARCVVSANSTTEGGGGGLGNAGFMVLQESGVDGNRTGALGHGGGIEQIGGGALGLYLSTLSGNTAELGGGGLALGQGVSAATLSSGTVVAGNLAKGGHGGGGIFVGDGSAVSLVLGSRVADNVAEGDWGGGGILATTGTSLTLTDSIVRDNRATAGGGGIRSEARVVITGSDLSGNLGLAGGGGLLLHQAGSTLLMVRSQVHTNQTRTDGGSLGGGGLLLSEGAIATVLDSHIEGNASDNGGGILLDQARLLLGRVAVTGNTAAQSGAGLLAQRGSTLDVRVSTLSGNRAGAWGGGLGVLDQAGGPDSIASLLYVTLSDNDAPQGGGLYDRGGQPTLAQASILAGNRQGGSPTDPGADCLGPVTIAGPNLLAVGTGCPVGGAGIRTVAPADVFALVLGPLGDHGGPSPTHDLLPGSPALDHPVLACGNPDVRNDQRGVARPRDGGGGVAWCDLGAYER